jgi:hypothetical protein
MPFVLQVSRCRDRALSVPALLIRSQSQPRAWTARLQTWPILAVKRTNLKLSLLDRIFVGFSTRSCTSFPTLRGRGCVEMGRRSIPARIEFSLTPTCITDGERISFDKHGSSSIKKRFTLACPLPTTYSIISDHYFCSISNAYRKHNDSILARCIPLPSLSYSKQTPVRAARHEIRSVYT